MSEGDSGREWQKTFVPPPPLASPLYLLSVACTAPAHGQEPADTSDAAYEKRHRKYETFEKRQRLREKEKLKHEQYKLKERIDQLRGMDPSAFLALPESDFSLPPDELSDVAELNGDTADGVLFHPHAHAPEGYRRRKEMLAVACSLEERYRTLLNPDKKPSGKRFTKVESATIQRAIAGSISDAEEEGEDEVEEAEEEEEEEPDELDESEVEDEPVSPRRPSYHDESGESEVDADERDRQRSKGLKLKIKFSLRTPTQAKDPLSKRKRQMQTTLSPFMAKAAKSASALARKADDEKLQSPTKLVSIAATSILTAASAPPRPRGPRGRYLPKGKEHSSASPAKGPPKKRPRTDSLASFTHPPTGKRVPSQRESISMGVARPMRLDSPGSRQFATYAGAAGRPELTTCVLMVAALRNSAAPNVRKTQRNVLAFGTRVPPELELVRDFEIPEWVFDQEAQSEEHDDASGDQNGGPYTYRSSSREFKQESVTSAALGSRQASMDEVGSPEGFSRESG